MNLMCVELAKSPSGVSRMVRVLGSVWFFGTVASTTRP